VKLIHFFLWWILIRLTWNLSRFVSNLVEILTRNFRKKPFWENISEILCKPSCSKTCEISPNILIFFFGSVLRWKNTQKYFCMLFAPRYGCTTINKSHKEYAGKKCQDVLFSENQFCSLSIWVLLRLNPWVFWSETFTRHSSLCLLSFARDLSPRLVLEDTQ